MEVKKQHKIRVSIVANILILVVYAGIALTPLLERSLTPYLIPALFLLWAIYTYSLIGVIKFRRLFESYWMLLILWMAIQSGLGLSETNVFGLLMQVPLYSMPIIMQFVLYYYNRDEKLLLAFFLYIIIMINVISNDIIGAQNPELYALLNTTDAGEGTNLGSTSLNTVCLLFMCSLTFVLFEVNNLLIRIVVCCSFVVTGYFFFILNSRGTSFFLFALFILGFLLAPPKYRISDKPIYFFTIVGVLGVLFFLVITPIMDGLRLIFENNERMLERINELQDYNDYGSDEEGSFNVRVQLSLLSIKTWLSNPINFVVGVGVHELKGTDISAYIKSGVGHHSQFFDYLAYYGIIGGYLLYRALKKSFKTILNLIQEKRIYNRVFMMLLVFVLYSFLNNSFVNNIFFVMFIFLPIIIDYVNEKK